MTVSGSKAKLLIGVAVVSLCLNFFLVGSMAGHWMHGPRFGGPDGGPGGDRRGFEAMISGVPEGLRPMVKDKFAAAKPQFDAARATVRDARQKVIAAAEADPFDPAAFDAAFQELQQAMGGMGAVANQTIRDILAQLPPDQRHKLVEKWSRRWGKGPGGPDNDGPPPPND